MSVHMPRANAVRNHALQFATIAHGSQVRKGNEHIPYIFHCVDVANEVTYYSGLSVPELEHASIIALLHDVVEDTAVSEEELRRQFGDVIADGVCALTKNHSIVCTEEYSRHEQLIENIARLKVSPPYVQSVKLADRVSNLKTFPAIWSREKVARYLEESMQISSELGSSSLGLNARLLSRVAETRVMMSLL